MTKRPVRLRPVTVEDLVMLRRFATEPGLIGPNWAGFRVGGAPERRFASDGYLGADDGLLIVEVADAAAGFVGWRSVGPGVAKYWNIGIVLLPECRGRGTGPRAQALLSDYLYAHSPAAVSLA
jgi:[ribosomal protein S5]-alanine N-acetyltransferase